MEGSVADDFVDSTELPSRAKSDKDEVNTEPVNDLALLCRLLYCISLDGQRAVGHTGMRPERSRLG